MPSRTSFLVSHPSQGYLLLLVVPQQAAVNKERRSRDVVGFLRCQEASHPGNVFGFSSLPSGIFPSSSLSLTGSFKSLVLIGVSIAPGAIELIVILPGASSIARLRVSILIPPLLAQ